MNRKCFLDKAQKKHGDLYDYSLNCKNEYFWKDLIKIICSKHGVFEQKLYQHLSGSGCKKCAYEKRSNILKFSEEKFIEKANKIHNFKYDYSLLEYNGAHKKVKIICPKHGIFEQVACMHLTGRGCKKCFGNKRKSTDYFIENAKEKHNNKYDYSLVEYEHCEKVVKIICPIHGVFEQTPSHHLAGSGCKKCGYNSSTKQKYLTQEEFINKSNMIHCNKYDYGLVDYKHSQIPVKIICPKHGVFEQIPNSHLLGCGCPQCFHLVSNKEKDVLNFIKTNYDGKIRFNYRKKIGLELDIYIPKLKLAFEFNGIYWHNELNKDKNYHLEKTKRCEEKGIHLIHIYEDDWIYKQEIVKSRILSLLGKCEKIYARKCIIKEVDSKVKGKFLNENHLQGNVGSKINLGLYYNDELVSIMTLGKRRRALGVDSKINNYELLRFCNKLNVSVVGGASKLFKCFIDNYKHEEVVSYANRSWTMNNGNTLYDKLGFKFMITTPPNYFYIVDGKRKHRFGFRKDALVKEGYDERKTEREIMLERKIYRIYNSGNLKYIYGGNNGKTI